MSASVSPIPFRTPYSDLLPRGLLTALTYHHDRWQLWTIYAAIAIPHCEELTPREWTDVLDRIESKLREVIPSIGVNVAPVAP